MPPAYRRVAWESWRAEPLRAHYAVRVGRVWRTLCGLESEAAEPVVDAWPLCKTCAKIAAKHDAHHIQPAPEGVESSQDAAQYDRHWSDRYCGGEIW